jgi:hypothetical protein
MMDEIYHSADEIVSTRGIGIQYTLVHLKKKASSVSLANALKTLEPIGVKGSEIFGYNNHSHMSTASHDYSAESKQLQQSLLGKTRTLQQNQRFRRRLLLLLFL